MCISTKPCLRLKIYRFIITSGYFSGFVPTAHLFFFRLNALLLYFWHKGHTRDYESFDSPALVNIDRRTIFTVPQGASLFIALSSFKPFAMRRVFCRQKPSPRLPGFLIDHRSAFALRYPANAETLIFSGISASKCT